MTGQAYPLARRGLLAGALAALAAPRPAQASTRVLIGLPPPGPLGQAMEGLGDHLLSATGLADPAGNRVISPWSVHAALGLLALGARGKTGHDFASRLGAAADDPRHLAEALHAAADILAQASTAEARLHRAEAAWVRKELTFQTEWQDLARSALGAEGQPLDFAAAAAAQTVNDWAAHATEGMITNLLDRLPEDADLVLGSAIHFAGHWASPFDAAETVAAPFRTAAGTTSDVPMMRSERPVLYGAAGLGHAVVLPYAGSRIAMLVATARQPEDTPAFLDVLHKQGVTGWLRSLWFAATGPMQLRLPRFGFDSGADLLPALNGIGLGGLLGSGADLAGITGSNVTVSAVRQRASIRVDEGGTVAAAATAVIASRSARVDQPAFSADRPFVFLIGTWEFAADAAFLPLFLGYVGDAAHAQA